MTRRDPLGLTRPVAFKRTARPASWRDGVAPPSSHPSVQLRGQVPGGDGYRKIPPAPLARDLPADAQAEVECPGCHARLNMRLLRMATDGERCLSCGWGKDGKRMDASDLEAMRLAAAKRLAPEGHRLADVVNVG